MFSSHRSLVCACLSVDCVDCDRVFRKAMAKERYRKVGEHA